MHRSFKHRLPLNLLFVFQIGQAVLLGSGDADPNASAKLEFFEKRVRPILADHCYA